MSKKTIFILMIGVLVVSACTPKTPEPIESPATEPTENVGETGTILKGERMPCSTVYDYATTAETDQYQALADQLPPVSDEDWAHGNPDASVTIVEYADFQCPACANFSLYLNALLEAYPTSIKVVFRHLPLPSIHERAYISSMAAEAAGAQGLFWEMHDLLYQTQGEWSGFTEEEFVSWAITVAESLELDVEQFEADLLDEDTRAALEETTIERLDLGVNYTPFVVINDRIFQENKPDLFALIGIHEFGGYAECPPWVIDPEGSYIAQLNTSAGEIEIELFADVAPLAVNSFVFLAQNGWYDGIYFHRVVEGFVAQAGDPSGIGVIGPGYTFVNETDAELSFDSAGILGMANAGADTNGSQFFLTLAPATNLDGSYTIFGKITTQSMPILDAIALRDPQTAVGFGDATIINGIEIIEK